MTMAQSNSALSEPTSNDDIDNNIAWAIELEQLLTSAATLAATNDIDVEAFMASAWAACLEANPKLREELADKELKSQINKLRKRGLIGLA